MRPYVICHMCTTLDGKILTDRWGFAGARNLYETSAASFGVKAWVVGTTTMKEFMGRNVKLKKATVKVGYEDFVARSDAKSFAIGVDAKGVLRFQEGEVEGDHVVLLVTKRVGSDYLAHLREAGVSYLMCGAKEVDLRLAMGKLRMLFGMKKLMLEGGGTFNGAMLKEGLVDEVSIVMVPVVDGGKEVTGVFEVEGLGKAVAKLKMIGVEKMSGGVHWMRYKVLRR